MDDLNKKSTNKNKKVLYSTEAIDENDNTSLKSGRLGIKEIKNDKDDSKQIWGIILKYELDGEQQEITIATLGEIEGLVEKAKAINELLEKQLIANKHEEKGFKYYEQLQSYLKSERIPFSLTVEGTEVLSYKKKEKTEIDTTYSVDTNGRLYTEFTEKQLEDMKKNNNSELLKYFIHQKNIEKWKERKEKILNTLDPEEKEKFLKGEKITQYIEETTKTPETKKTLAGDYLIEALEENQDTHKLELAKGLFAMQDKGFAIDVKVVLEKQRDKLYNAIQEEKTDKKTMDAVLQLLTRMDEYAILFDLVKDGKQLNARYRYEWKKLNLSEVKALCKSYNPEDKEIQKYIDLKEKTLQDKTLNKVEKENNYNDSENMKQLYKFLMRAKVRDYTNTDGLYSAKNIVIDNGNYLSNRLYEHIIRELAEYNLENIETYNKYAKKSEGIFVYDVNNKENGKEPIRTFSNTVKQISNELLKTKEAPEAPGNLKNSEDHGAPDGDER